MNGQCLRCKQQREIQAPKEVPMKNGKRAYQGHCAVCGAKIFRIAKG